MNAKAPLAAGTKTFIPSVAQLQRFERGEVAFAIPGMTWHVWRYATSRTRQAAAWVYTLKREPTAVLITGEDLKVPSAEELKLASIALASKAAP